MQGTAAGERSVPVAECIIFRSAYWLRIVLTMVCMGIIGQSNKLFDSGDRACRAPWSTDIICERIREGGRGKRAAEIITYCALTDLHPELSVRL